MSAIPCAFLSETLDQVLGIVDRDLAAMLPAKAARYRPFVIDALPALTAQQTADPGPLIIEALQVRQPWIIRNKTAAELLADEGVADRAALQADAIIAKFKAEVAGTSTLTAAQFRVLTSRCLLYLMRRSI